MSRSINMPDGRYAIEHAENKSPYVQDEKEVVDLSLRFVESSSWDGRAIFSMTIAGDGSLRYLNLWQLRNHLVRVKDGKLVSRTGRQIAEDTLISERHRHTVPRGSLVEVETGARLFIVAHLRGPRWEPTYGLASEFKVIEPQHEENGFLWQIRVCREDFQIIREVV